MPWLISIFDWLDVRLLRQYHVVHWYRTGYLDGLVQERRNSIAKALELRLSCTNPSIWCHWNWRESSQADCFVIIWSIWVCRLDRSCVLSVMMTVLVTTSVSVDRYMYWYNDMPCNLMSSGDLWCRDKLWYLQDSKRVTQRSLWGWVHAMRANKM